MNILSLFETIKPQDVSHFSNGGCVSPCGNQETALPNADSIKGSFSVYLAECSAFIDGGLDYISNLFNSNSFSLSSFFSDDEAGPNHSVGVVSLQSDALQNKPSENMITLLNLSFANGPWGKAQLNWSKDLPIDKWEGVKFNEDKEVISLDLSGKNLINFCNRKTIPKELGKLNKLQYLNLSSCNLTGNIPQELCDITTLKTLILSKNRLSSENIPDELADLPNFRSLVIDLAFEGSGFVKISAKLQKFRN